MRDGQRPLLRSPSLPLYAPHHRSPSHLTHTYALLLKHTQAPLPPVRLRFAERFLEFLVDLLGQLPTRRFLKARSD